MVVFGAVSIISSLMNDNPDYLYAIGVLKDNSSIPVVNTDTEVNLGVVKPYISDTLEVKVPFYDNNADEISQQKALIYFKNTYMKNTGVLYASSEDFDVIMTLDGVVKAIKDDEILGKVIEIEHSPNLRTIYYSVSDVKVKVGDELKQGDVIARSGVSKISEDKANLLFEVYYNGVIINPEAYYEMDVSTLK